jgi:hypothetical protein
MNENSFTYLLLDEKEVNDVDAFSFLNEVRNEILKKYSIDDLKLFSAFQFSNGTEILKKYLKYYNEHPVITKTGEIISDLNLAKDAIIENVEKILERDNKMDLVVKKSVELQKFSENINNITKTIRKSETQRKNKFIIFSIIIIGILVALILILT